MFKSVLFPEPEGPLMETYSPRLMAKSTPLSARVDSGPEPYFFFKSIASIEFNMDESTVSVRIKAESSRNWAE